MRQIERVEPLPGYRLRVTWRDGQRMTIDFSSDIKRGGVWEPLTSPSAFSAVGVVKNGEALEWDSPRDSFGDALIDVDADGLFMMGMEQSVAPVMRDVAELVRKKLEDAPP